MADTYIASKIIKRWASAGISDPEAANGYPLVMTLFRLGDVYAIEKVWFSKEIGDISFHAVHCKTLEEAEQAFARQIKWIEENEERRY